MNRKITALVTLACFSALMVSCQSVQRTLPERVAPGGDNSVYRLEKKSGEVLSFFKEYPAYLYNGEIRLPKSKQVKIQRADLKHKTYKVIDLQRKLAELTTKQGESFKVVKIIKETKDFVMAEVLEPETISLPINDVKYVWVNRFNTAATIVGLTVVAALVGGIILLATSLDFGPDLSMNIPGATGSCSFIYSFDGTNYIFDAEPYGGAICRGLQRTEWCTLENATEVDGHYRLLVRNELDETQHTDELRLVVVDHPAGLGAVPDESGRMHTIRRPQPPRKAFDKEGRDILPLVSAKDKIFWTSAYEDRERFNKDDLREALVFEFPKPRDAKSAKLLVHADTEIWGSQAAKRFLSLHGEELPLWYDEINRMGPAFQRAWSWYATEELFLLKVHVETRQGWMSKGTIFGGGPFISEDKAYSIDVSDVPGDKLRIKLTPPVNFWRMDSLAVDYTEDQPLQTAELAPLEAVDWQGRDVKDLLCKKDGNAFIMPEPGQYAQVVFGSPSRPAGLERTVFVKATGYYDIHVKAEGAPQRAVLDKIHAEPGFTLMYAYEEYQKMKAAAKPRAGAK